MSRSSLRIFAVRQADAAVGDATGQDLGLVGAVDPDEAAAGPVRERRRAGRRAERERAVDRVVEAAEPVADDEPSPRSRPLPPADARHGRGRRCARGARAGRSAAHGRRSAASGRPRTRSAGRAAPSRWSRSAARGAGHGPRPHHRCCGARAAAGSRASSPACASRRVRRQGRPRPEPRARRSRAPRRPSAICWSAGRLSAKSSLCPAAGAAGSMTASAAAATMPPRRSRSLTR